MSTKLFTKKKKQVTTLRKNFKKLTGFFCLKVKIRQNRYVSVDSVLAAVLLPLWVTQQKYYLYELSGTTVIERPRQIYPYLIVAFQYKEPKKMAAPDHESILELSENVLISPWKGKLIIKGCLLCDITLLSSYGTVVPTQLPHELDFKYVMKVTSLKKILPEAIFRKQNYLEQKVCCQDMHFNMYEVELSNKQGDKIDKLTEVIKNKQLALIKCLEDREAFILLTSSAFISETNFGEEQMTLHGLHLFHSSLSAGLKDLKVEDDISLKVKPVLPALNCALLEARKSYTEEGICLNTLVKHNFQELYKMERNPLTAFSQDGVKETAFFGKLSNGFDLVPPDEKCPVQSLTQLKSYFSDPNGYILEVSTVLDLLAEHPQSPCISDGICDAGFSLVMTPDPEFLDSEAEIRKETETKKNAEEMFKVRKRNIVPLNAAANLRVQPKRKATMPPVVQSKRVNLCSPFPKRTPARASRSSAPPTTLKLVKGQFPQKRKRGAEVLTAEFVQTTKLDRKTQEALISKDVPVATTAKRARKQGKSPVKTVPRAKPPVKISPQKQRVNIVKGNQNPRIRKQPQPAKGETASQLQSKLSLCGQKDAIGINTAQPENITVAQKAPTENPSVNCDSQALNLLADLALSAATSTTQPSEPRNLPCPSELPQSNVLLPKEHSLSNASDHEYHRGVKSKKGRVLPKPSSDKSNLTSDSTLSQEDKSLISDNQTPIESQSALPEETMETSDASQSSVAVEHSYALLLAEHSKKVLQQRGLPGPAFTKNGPKGPEAGTPVGKVMPFRHQLSTSPIQKLPEDPVLKRRSRLLSSSLRDFHCSRTVFSCDGSFKVTFRCETNYVFSLDSKYTNNPLEKTVLRALHGPWNTDLPDCLEEVKLLLHMWVALFYSNQNRVIRSSRKVVEHSNPAKYVSINTTIESFQFSEIEESPSVERCSVGPLLETEDAPRGHSAEVSFPDTKALLPFIKTPPARGLEHWVQNEQKEVFVRKDHSDTPEKQNFIYSCNNEIIEGKSKQESSDKTETCNHMLSNTGSIQINGPSIPGEDKTFEPHDSTRGTSFDTVTQTTFTKTCDGISNQSVICQKSMNSPPESKVDNFHATMQAKASGFQALTEHSSPQNKECQPSQEKKGDTGYVMINLEPVTLTFEKNACIPIQAEIANRPDKPTVFNMELIKQVPPATSLRLPISTFEKVQTQGLKDILSLAMSGEKGTKYLCASSVSKETLANNEIHSLQKEIPVSGSSLLSHNSLEKETLPFVKSSNSSLPREEMKLSQELTLQPKSLLSISSEEILEPSQIEETSPSASAMLEKNYSLSCIPSRSNTSNGSLELKSDKSGLNSENMNFESFKSIFTKQTSLSINGEEVSLELEEDSDIDLALTISPPTSPREEMPAGETEQNQEAPLSNLELQDTDEDIINPQEVAFIENREVNSAKYTSALELTDEVNVTSDFPFGSLIEEVSPASSPDPQIPVEETQPSRDVSLCNLKHPDAQSGKSDKFSHIESVDLAKAEKVNSFGPIYPMGQNNLARLRQIQLPAEMPLLLNNHPGRKDRDLTLLSKVTKEIVPSEHVEGCSFSEKVPCCNTELNQPASAGSYRDDFKISLEKLVTSGNPLQPISIENRNSGLNHLTLENSEPPFSPRKILENKSLVVAFVSTNNPSDIVNVSLNQQTSPKSSDVKINEGSCMQVQSLSSDSVDGANNTQAHIHSEIPNLTFSSSGATGTHFTRPINIETGFQTQEISVVRMASLLKNSETEAGIHENSIDLEGVDSESSTTSPEGKQKTIHMPQDMSTCKTKNPLNKGLFPMYLYADSHQHTAVSRENVNKEPSAFFVPKSCAPVVCGLSKEQVENKSSGQELGNEEDSETLGGDMDISVNSDFHYEPLSGDSDQDSFGDCRNLKLDMESSCTLQCSHKKVALKGGYDSFLSLNNSDNDDWAYSNRVPELETSIPPRNWFDGLKKDKCVPCYIQIRDFHGIPRTYTNFTVTKEVKDTKRTLPCLRRQPNFTAKHSLLNSWTNTWQIADNLTQNTLDLEYLSFQQKLKQIVKNGDSQLSPSSTNDFVKEPPLQIVSEAFPLPKITESSVLHPPSRSESTLLITIMHSDSRPQSQHPRHHRSSNLDSSSFWKERCDLRRNHLTNSERNQTVSFHLNKLKYNSTLKESRNDIALILNEYSEFNKVMMNGSQVNFRDKESNVGSGETTSQEMYSSSPRKSATYEDMITDLCSSLHVKLKSVVKEACKSTFLFYLVETEDQSFFVRTKNILRKGGHTEIEPQHFCQAFHRENDTLMVIIKNEDISSHLHQIPCLLKLKHFPSVIFAGVDSSEDVLNYTFQELFPTGGFVVSDDRILETLTLVQLKEIVKALEKLNGNGRWKWLLHYRENKKLKEDVRVDSIAHKKNLILKYYQSANIIELLHYHQCDSRSSTKAEHLKCLLNLQIQHIHARFAVFLTEKPVSREVFENSGILVTDVNNFIENIQKVAAPFRSSYW